MVRARPTPAPRALPSQHGLGLLLILWPAGGPRIRIARHKQHNMLMVSHERGVGFALFVDSGEKVLPPPPPSPFPSPSLFPIPIAILIPITIRITVTIAIPLPIPIAIATPPSSPPLPPPPSVPPLRHISDAPPLMDGLSSAWACSARRA